MRHALVSRNADAVGSKSDVQAKQVHRHLRQCRSPEIALYWRRMFGETHDVAVTVGPLAVLLDGNADICRCSCEFALSLVIQRGRPTTILILTMGLRGQTSVAQLALGIPVPSTLCGITIETRQLCPVPRGKERARIRHGNVGSGQSRSRELRSLDPTLLGRCRADYPAEHRCGRRTRPRIGPSPRMRRMPPPSQERIS